MALRTAPLQREQSRTVVASGKLCRVPNSSKPETTVAESANPPGKRGTHDKHKYSTLATTVHVAIVFRMAAVARFDGRDEAAADPRHAFADEQVSPADGLAKNGFLDATHASGVRPEREQTAAGCTYHDRSSYTWHRIITVEEKQVAVELRGCVESHRISEQQKITST